MNGVGWGCVKVKMGGSFIITVNPPAKSVPPSLQSEKWTVSPGMAWLRQAHLIDLIDRRWQAMTAKR